MRSAVKFITGNPNANDPYKYKENIKAITLNIDGSNKKFSRLKNFGDFTIQIQYLIYFSEMILNILNDINDHLKIIYTQEELLPSLNFIYFKYSA